MEKFLYDEIKDWSQEDLLTYTIDLHAELDRLETQLAHCERDRGIVEMDIGQVLY